MEGIGGPVNLERYSTDGIDPALEDCCRREVLGNRRQNALTSSLRRHDVAGLAERRRRHLVTIPNGDDHDEGCRCSYNPNSDGGEYKALIEFKKHKQQQQKIEEEFEGTNKRIEREDAAFERKIDINRNNNDSGDTDSDNEFDYLLDEDFGEDENVRHLEQQRREELEYQMLMRQVAGYHGYGVHRQIHPTRVLRIAGLGRDVAKSRKASIPSPPSAVVLHLVDADSVASASLDYFIENELAKQYPGTMFMRSGGRSVLLMDSSLAQKSFPPNILDAQKDMPALLAIRDGVVINACPRLLGLTVDSGNGEIESHALEEWLHRSRVLLTDIPHDDVCLIRPEEEVHMDFIHSQQQHTKQEPPHEKGHYNCGIKGCQKSFKHEHIGIETSEQSGLMINKETILGQEED